MTETTEHTTPKAVEPGVVSEGTLKPEDVIPKMLEVLHRLNPGQACRFRIDYDEYASNHTAPDATENMFALWGDVDDAINEELPDGFWYGAHEGDGALFGIWNDNPGRDEKPARPVYKRREYRIQQQASRKWAIVEHVASGENRVAMGGFARARAVEIVGWLNDAVDRFIEDNNL